MAATSDTFHLLDPAVQRWIYEQGWTELRDAQERAAAPILDGSLDVIIASATASGVSPSDAKHSTPFSIACARPFGFGSTPSLRPQRSAFSTYPPAHPKSRTASVQPWNVMVVLSACQQ